MRTDDPWEAAQKAIAWAKQDRLDLKSKKQEQAQQDEQSLAHYWETWLARESKRRCNKRGFTKWLRENKRLWSAEGYGIQHQPFAKKSVLEICYADFLDFWAVLDARALSRGNATNGGASKKDSKTLINHLLKEARDTDHKTMVLPGFPPISHQRHERDHFTRQEWDGLIQKVVELSGGAAQQDLTHQEYLDLPSAHSRIKSQRNWVDLYDALLLMWFFHLRAEDLPRLKAEWFAEGAGNKQVICTLQVTKRDRNKEITENARPDGHKFWKRLAKRKPSGYLVLPHKDRPDGDPVRSSVGRDIRDLFNHAKSQVQPPITRPRLSPMQVRHTAFRLIVEEDPRYYQTPEGLAELARCGNTSTQELREKYLEPVLAAQNLAASRERLPEADWSMVKRIDLT